ncbi:808_t:CDS:2 [Funneliformis geosporum]|nr:808_t:CDS:2 [Funneliformis geosporum]
MKLLTAEVGLKSKQEQIELMLTLTKSTIKEAVSAPKTQLNIGASANIGSLQQAEAMTTGSVHQQQTINEGVGSSQTEPKETKAREKICTGLKLVGEGTYQCLIEEVTNKVPFLTEEIRQRATCDFVLYTITKEMLGFYAIAEVVDDSNKRPHKTIFCYLETGFQKHQIKSLQAIARMVKENGVQVFTSLEEVAEYLNNQAELVAQVELRKCPNCQLV